MFTYSCFLILLASQSLLVVAITGKSWVGWDCCKPICATTNGNSDLLNSRGVVKVCNKNNNAWEQQSGIDTLSGCNGGGGFACQDFQPIPVDDNLSYGFAWQVVDNQRADGPSCCKCYDLKWTSGAAFGKRMIIQVLSPGIATPSLTVKNNDMIIMAPGGGQGPQTSGCLNQYGSSYKWGNIYGGATDRKGCETLPSNLQGGCYWRFNWAGGVVTNWDVNYSQTECPSRLTDISGCSA